MRHVDQVLAFHHAGGQRYELSGLRTGSIRDQILRATVLVERLVAFKDIGPGSPLFVVGGGAAGVAAALAACSLGVDSTIVELRNQPFSVQVGVRTRFLDPTEFDWPHDHWGKADMSWQGTNYPLPFISEYAHKLLQQWQSVFQAVIGGAISLPGQLEFLWGVDAQASFKYTDGPLESSPICIGPWPGYPAPGRPFGAAISCIGSLKEQTEAPSTSGGIYYGQKFWGSDTIDLPDFGLNTIYQRSHSGVINVLVSGGGDGAQQDFLRALTGRFGKRLFTEFAPLLKGIDLTPLVLADDAGRRAHAWSRDKSPLRRDRFAWNAAYERVIAKIWSGWSRSTKADICKAVLRSGICATWVLGGDSPAYCYGLNRLLVYLVAHLHAFHAGRPLYADSHSDMRNNAVIVRNHKIDSVSAIDPMHSCKSHAQCFGVPHNVSIQEQGPKGPGVVSTIGPFHVIVIRHGVKRGALFRSAPVSDQMVAYDIPA